MKSALCSSLIFLLVTAAALASSSRLRGGTEFPVREKALHLSKTCYVDGQAKNADDKGPGSKERPFLTINAAAQVLQPGERVVIAEGVYHECVRPARGGARPDSMISYEAAPGAKVAIRGSVVTKGWHVSEGWNLGIDPNTKSPVKAWELRLDPSLFQGYNPFESESGGAKMHVAKNLLFRNNVIRHIRHANSIGLDIGNANVRITGNLFADIPGDVNPHAVHIEASDDNIFSNLTGGILIRDTNNVIAAYNLFLDCKEVCVDTVSGINGHRPIIGHTNDVHSLMVHDNTFYGMGRSAIEFTNARNEADGNVYPNPAGGQRGAQPLLRVKTPEPPEWHNLKSWREEHGWGMNGAMADVTAILDPGEFELKLSVTGDFKPASAYKEMDTDYFGRPVTTDRMPGPFSDLGKEPTTRDINPM